MVSPYGSRYKYRSRKPSNYHYRQPTSCLQQSALFGFFYLVCLLFSIQDFDNTVNSPYGQPVLQIFADIYGPNGAVALMSIVILCVYCCGLFSLTSNSRFVFSYILQRKVPDVTDETEG